MPFSEEIKSTVRRKSLNSCCLCHTLYVEIHHITPESEGGSETEENAAPLCPTCHEIYGSNPSKRKMIIEMRDLWYEICERRQKLESKDIKEIRSMLEDIPTKIEIEKLLDQLFAKVKMENKETATMTTDIEEKRISLPEGLYLALTEKYEIDKLVQGIVMQVVGGWSGCSFASIEEYLEVGKDHNIFTQENINEIKGYLEYINVILQMRYLPDTRIPEIKYYSDKIRSQLLQLKNLLPNLYGSGE